MGRRKRDVMDDDSSDSDASVESGDGPLPSLNPDEQAEHDLYADPYQRKRRRRNGKEDALYGIFGEDEDGPAGRGASGSRAGGSRVDWTKAPSFVSGDTTRVDIDKELAEAASAKGEDSESVEEGSDNEETSDSDTSRPPSPRVRDVYEDDEPARVGFGRNVPWASSIAEGDNASAPESTPPLPEPETTLGASKTSRRAGIGSKPVGDTPGTSDLPSAFGTPGGAPRTQRSFLRQPAEAPKAKPSLTTEEVKHFTKLKGTFGAKMLEKMGWQIGSGLGAASEGIVNPVESKLRPQKMGIGHGGFREKTEQSRAEARRRGEASSGDEGTSKKAQLKKGKVKGKHVTEVDYVAGREQWKRKRKIKTVVQHRTYEEIMAEAGQETTPSLGIIIDATGAKPREITSLSQASSSPWGATNDPERLPELRHNLRLIVDLAKGDLDGLAREGKSLEERKKWVHGEDQRLRKKITEEAQLISRLQKVTLVVDDINIKSKEAMSSEAPSLDVFTTLFQTLIIEHSSEFHYYNLDGVVVAAIAPSVRQMLLPWLPLENPTFLTKEFYTWKDALKMTAFKDPGQQVGLIHQQSYPSVLSKESHASTGMTPYESLLWNAWLPKVRSCVNNDWSVDDPQPLIALLEAWRSLLPQFVYDNVLDQLVLPKVNLAVSEWSARNGSGSLHALVFPWLPHVGLRMEAFIADPKRKVKSLFRVWKLADGTPEDLLVWKDIFDPSEWQALLLKHVVPKLASALRDDLKINPRKQDMEPISSVLGWFQHIKRSVFAQILETEFFPKWLSILHVWLIQPNVNYDQVEKWFKFWKKDVFTEEVASLPAVAHGFKSGLDLINQATSLGPNAVKLLPKPQFLPLSSSSSQPYPSSKQTEHLLAGSEVTFRSIVEDYAASHNLLFIPSGKTHERSRLPLYKISQNVEGKGGILVYLQDEAVWAAAGEGEDYRAIGLDEMVLRATKRR